MTDPSSSAPEGAPAEADAQATTASPAERDTLRATWRGFRRRCPNCGSGPLMKGFLQVRDHCPVCREEYHHHRADDGPAYLTILIVGHIMAPLLLVVYTAWRPEPLVLFTIFLIATVGLSLFLLPRFKGGLVAFQWARRMHGFEGATSPAPGGSQPAGAPTARRTMST